MKLQTPMAVTSAFDYMADLNHFADWDPGVKSVRQVEGTSPGPGSRYEVTIAAGRRDLTLTYVTTLYDPPSRIVVRAESGLLVSEDRITVTAEGPGSTVEYDANLALKRGLSVFDPLLGVVFRKVAGRAASGLLARLDATRV